MSDDVFTDMLEDELTEPLDTELAKLRAEWVPLADVRPLVEALGRANRWISHNQNKTSGDHACAECYPHSDILIEGFRCAAHDPTLSDFLTKHPTAKP